MRGTSAKRKRGEFLRNKPIEKWKGAGMKSYIAEILSLVILTGCITCFSFPSYGGVLASTASKAAAKKAALRQSSTNALRTKSAATSGVIKGVSKEESAALQRQLHAMDKNAVARIEQRYGDYIPVGRFRESVTCSTCFMNSHAYDVHLRQTYPKLSAEQRKAILGDFKNGRIYVQSESKDLQKTVAHERFHQMSHRDFRSQAGSRLDEGFTEYFTGKTYRDLHIVDRPTVYPNEQRLVQMMHARTGEGPLATAYFNGNTVPLRSELDRQLGHGAFQRIVTLAQRGEFAAAERLLINGL